MHTVALTNKKVLLSSRYLSLISSISPSGKDARVSNIPHMSRINYLTSLNQYSQRQVNLHLWSHRNSQWIVSIYEVNTRRLNRTWPLEVLETSKSSTVRSIKTHLERPQRATSSQRSQIPNSDREATVGQNSGNKRPTSMHRSGFLTLLTCFKTSLKTNKKYRALSIERR